MANRPCITVTGVDDLAGAPARVAIAHAGMVWPLVIECAGPAGGKGIEDRALGTVTAVAMLDQM